MTPILNIIPKVSNDNTSLMEHTKMYKEQILDNLGINSDKGIINKIEYYIINIFNKNK